MIQKSKTYLFRLGTPFFGGSGFSGATVLDGYRKNYFFWCFHVGWVFLFLGWSAWVELHWLQPGVVVLVPVGATLLYGGWALTGRGEPGTVALWLTLVTAAAVGLVCVGHLTTQADRLVWGPFLVDALSVPFVFLTVTLAPLVVLASLDSVRKNARVYYFGLMFLFGALVLTFSVGHFLVFYLLFELLGFPMFMLIGVYGPRAQRIGAAYKFFVYTFVGSAFILPAFVFFYSVLGSTGIDFLLGYQFTEFEQVFLFGLVAFPFAVKIPVMPVHLWLPEAHVEAPTPVSMLLAGLLLKTGGYAFLRFVVPVLPFGVYVWGPALNVVGLAGVILASVYALVQVDVKRMIAYASVAHMSVVFCGLFTEFTAAVQGGVYLMLAHGYISAGLFAGIGVLYDRYHTRTIRYFGGLAGAMPLFGVAFFVLTLGNLSFPFTGGFTGEFLLLLGLAQKNLVVAAGAAATVFLSLCYSVWLYNRVFYGAVNPAIRRHQDVTPVEVAVVGWCAGWTLVLGFGGGLFCGYSHGCYTYLVCGVTLG